MGKQQMLNLTSSLVKRLPHLCDTCKKEFATCESNILFGVDLSPSLINEEADKVIECDNYEKTNG